MEGGASSAGAKAPRFPRRVSVIEKKVIAEYSKEPLSAVIETHKITLFATREYIGAYSDGKGDCIRLKVVDMLNILNTSLEEKK